MHQNNTGLNVYVYFMIIGAALIASIALSHMQLWNQVIFTFSGLVFFTFAEYAIHRYFLHSAAVMRRIGKSNISHLVHHERPKDESRLDLALVPSLLFAAFFLLIFWLMFSVAGFSFFAGFLLGYTIYVVVHYRVHFSHPPKSFIKYLWQHHAVHHYVDERRAYGVTTPFWDIVFGTMPVKKAKHK